MGRICQVFVDISGGIISSEILVTGHRVGILSRLLLRLAPCVVATRLFGLGRPHIPACPEDRSAEIHSLVCADGHIRHLEFFALTIVFDAVLHTD